MWIIKPTPKMIKVLRWIALILPLVLIAAAIPFSIYYYYEYYSGKVTGYEELEKREYTFVKFDYAVRGYHKKYRNLEIYVAEEIGPLLGATSIDMAVIDADVLERAQEGDTLTVWISPNSGLIYDYTVHEGSINGEFFLTMENYREMSRRNERVAVLLVPALGVPLLAFGIWFFIHAKNIKLE